jgi:2-oxoglutarate dehydrogenase E1 component
MYELINARPKVREIYGAQLMAQGSAQQADVDAAWETAKGSFMGSYERVQQNNAYKSPSYMDGLWKNYRGGADKDVPQPNTGVDKAKLSELLNKLAAVPEGFTPLPQIAKILAGRRAMAEGKERLNWGAAENLAYATLLAEGVPVRLTGQDVERGTFSHRHARILDAKTNAKYTPLANLGGAQGTFSVFNSPLSEMAPVGFEFGYSLDYPDALVIWEAQFGDFANMAQAIIDQFISASEEKWKRLSGLTLLLPHGYEGMGPEHSSARLERFLDLCGDDNIQVCYPSTSAQIFHLLRRQVVRPIRKPLVVMTPKQLLREGGATCSLDELATGSFQRVIADPANPEAGTVEKLVFCAGKVFHTLNDARTKNPDSGKHVALVRIEQLYPFPADEVAAALAKYPNLKSVCWAQEEPRNMGSWRYISPRLIDLLKTANRSALELHYIGRAEAASPATGVEAAHQLEQQMIVDDAFSRGGTRAG